MKLMERLKRHPRVAYVSDERDIGNGVGVELREGWTFDALCDNRFRMEDTVQHAYSEVVRSSVPFAGPYDR